MTDRYHGFYVTLDKDIREDDFEAIKNAVSMIRHVQSVTPEVSDFAFHSATERVRAEFGTKLFEVIREFRPGGGK